MCKFQCDKTQEGKLEAIKLYSFKKILFSTSYVQKAQTQWTVNHGQQVHGGTTYKDIEKKVEQAEEMARVNEALNIDTVLFFDEANTTDGLGMIKEVMVDRRVNGRKIGVGLKRLQFIAACNPYRK